MQGKHAKPNGRERRVLKRQPPLPSPRRQEQPTREFPLPSRKKEFARYFFFTLLVCLLLAGGAAAALSVDFRGRDTAEGADLTFAFAVSEEGKAKLSFLGRDVTADVSFLRPVGDFLSETGTLLSSRIPGTLRMIGYGLPEGYKQVCRVLAHGEKAVVDLATGDW